MNTTEILAQLAPVPGVTGDEQAVAQAAAALLRPLCARVEVNAGGSVCAVLSEHTGGDRILLDAHIDQVGLIVTGIDERGFVRVSPCGGIDARTLPAAAVTIHGTRDIPGVVCALPPHLMKLDANSDEFLAVDKLRIDIGLDKAGAQAAVTPGDRVTIDDSGATLLNGLYSSRALDNRAGVVTLVRVAQILQDKQPLACDVTILLSTQEEVTQVGAVTGAFALEPDEAVVVDTSFGYSHDTPRDKSADLGGGPMIGYAPVLDRKIFEQLKAICEQDDLPYQLEVSGSTGTNADKIALSRAGVRAGLVSIPLRYMHMPVETIDPRDVDAGADLIVRYLLGKGARHNG